MRAKTQRPIERHLQTLKAISDTVNHLRLEVEATKIEWKVDIAPITKFTYLRELVTPQVSRTIEALPFTAEGYNRAKSILKEKFGKDSETIKAYTKETRTSYPDGHRSQSYKRFQRETNLLCASFTNAKQARASKRSYFDDP